ncbi:MAG: SDR family NAD(P)-dependent oxidoreductase [Deltaproteobacteria bacterium]
MNAHRKKTILITGANKGIGFEMALQLGKMGHQIILSTRDITKLDEALKKLKSYKIAVSGLLMDVSSEDAIKAAANEFAGFNMSLDVLINNAGIGLKADRSLLNENEEIMQNTLATNSFGPLRVVKTFLRFMNKHGRIIMISSGGGSMTDPVGGWWPSYCVSKSFLNAITRHLAFELKNEAISVNAVCPGWVRTDMGGQDAIRSVEKGAATPVWLATEADQKLTGMFFRDKAQIPW